MDDREIYWEVERTIDYAFDHKFFLNMYEYLKLKKTKKVDVREFIESSTAKEIKDIINDLEEYIHGCLLYTSPSPRDRTRSRMPSSA